MEAIIKERLTDTILSGTVYVTNIVGFGKGDPGSQTSFSAFEDWTKSLDDGFGLHIMFLDYRKAFDSVPHERLVSKLKTFGISVKLQNWIRNFLTTRTMQVNVRGTPSIESF